MKQLEQYAHGRRSKVKLIRSPKRRLSPDLIITLKDGRIVIVKIDITIIKPEQLEGKQ